jgi:hypothetical protein
MSDTSNDKPIDPIELFNQLSTSSSISINDFYAEAPKLRYSHEALGKLLLLPKSDLVVTPFRQETGGWYAVVVRGNSTYPVGGHNLFISDVEIESALEYKLGDIKPATPRKESDPNSIFSRILKVDLDSLPKVNLDPTQYISSDEKE